MISLDSERIQGRPELELETPVAEVEAPMSAAPFAFSMLPTHLAERQTRESFEPGGSGALEIAKKAGELALPDTLHYALTLLRELSRSEPTDKLGRAVKAAQLKRIARHIHGLSQAPPPPRIDHKAFWTRTPSPLALARIAKQYPKSKSA